MSRRIMTRMKTAQLQVNAAAFIWLPGVKRV